MYFICILYVLFKIILNVILIITFITITHIHHIINEEKSYMNKLIARVLTQHTVTS